MVEEILDRIRVDTDNDRLTEVLSRHFGVKIPQLKPIQEEFIQILEEEKANHTEKIKAHLLAPYGISGSAVIPNIEKDPAWQKKQNAIIDRFQSRLDTEK
jgi:hypothetical protein